MGSPPVPQQEDDWLPGPRAPVWEGWPLGRKPVLCNPGHVTLLPHLPWLPAEVSWLLGVTE